MRKEGKWVIGATLAAGVGYVAGVLSAPRSGWRTRKKLASSANKAKIDGEKQLKKLYTDLSELITDANKKLKTSRKDVNLQLKKQVAAAKKTKEKTKILLSALHNGEAEDPDLKDMLEEARKAKANLAKFFKK